MLSLADLAHRSHTWVRTTIERAEDRLVIGTIPQDGNTRGAPRRIVADAAYGDPDGAGTWQGLARLLWQTDQRWTDPLEQPTPSIRWRPTAHENLIYEPFELQVQTREPIDWRTTRSLWTITDCHPAVLTDGHQDLSRDIPTLPAWVAGIAVIENRFLHTANPIISLT